MAALPHILLFRRMLHLRIQMPCHPRGVCKQSIIVTCICLGPADVMTSGYHLQTAAFMWLHMILDTLLQLLALACPIVQTSKGVVRQKQR